MRSGEYGADPSLYLTVVVYFNLAVYAPLLDCNRLAVRLLPSFVKLQ